MATKLLTAPVAKDVKATSGSHGSTKAIVTILLILNVLALGGFAYLSLIMSRNVQDSLKRSKLQLIRLKEQTEVLARAADSIKDQNQAPVSVPVELITQVARDFKLQDKVKASKSRNVRWKKSNIFEEQTVEVQFLDKEGYVWRELHRFLNGIEATNSKVQIKSINFGQRDDGGDTWRPLSMTVRVFTPTLKRTGT